MPGLPSVAASSQGWASVGSMWSTSLNEGWLGDFRIGSTGGFTVNCSPTSSGYIFTSSGDGTTGSGNLFYTIGREIRIVQGSTSFYGRIATAVVAAGVTTVGLSSGSVAPTAGLSTGVAFTSVAARVNPGVGQRTLTTVNAVRTTTSVSYVDLTGATKTLTTNGGDVSIQFDMVAYNQTNGNGVFIQLVKDGTAFGTPPQGVSYTGGTASQPQSVSIHWTDIAPTPGSHTYKVQWKVDGGTGSNGGYEMRLSVNEWPH